MASSEVISPPTSYTYEAQSWWTKSTDSWTKAALTKMLKLNGDIPEHIAIVMDGNRRFAREHKLGSVLRGHERGFEQLQKLLSWCHDVGVREVTVYAFSIENFKRSDQEVEGLMHLAEEQFKKLLAEEEKLREQEVSFRFWGRLELLRPELRRLLVAIENMTRGYTKGAVNICMPYTAKDEIVRATEVVRQAARRGIVAEDEVSEAVLRQCMDSRRSRDPDLIIRTSGEQRWSDFLLFQCAFTHVYFTNVLWPEFEFTNLFKAIWDYQTHHKCMQAIPRPDEGSEEEISEEMKQFIEDFHTRRFEELVE